MDAHEQTLGQINGTKKEKTDLITDLLSRVHIQTPADTTTNMHGKE